MAREQGWVSAGEGAVWVYLAGLGRGSLEKTTSLDDDPISPELSLVDPAMRAVAPGAAAIG